LKDSEQNSFTIDSFVVKYPYRGAPYDVTYYYDTFRLDGYTDYDNFASLVTTNRADDIERELGSVNGLRVAVMGCAFGYLVKELYDRGADVTGYDVSIYAIDKAQTLFPTISARFVQLDCMTMIGVLDDTFDIIIDCATAFVVSRDMNDLANFLFHYDRVCKSAGKMYLLFNDNWTKELYLEVSDTDANSYMLIARPSATITMTAVGHIPISAQWRMVVS